MLPAPDRLGITPHFRFFMTSPKKKKVNTCNAGCNAHKPAAGPAGRNAHTPAHPRRDFPAHPPYDIIFL